MNEIKNFIVFITVILEYILFFYTIFRKRFRSFTKKRAICAGLMLLLLLCGSLGKWNIILTLSAGIIVSIFAVCFILEVSLGNTIKLYFVAFPALSILESIVGYILKAVSSIGEIERTIAYMLCIMIGLCLYYIMVGRKLDEDAFQMPGRIWMAVSVVMFVIVGMISYFTYVLAEVVHMKGVNIGLLLVAAGGFIIFILNYVMLYYFNIEQKFKMEANMLELFNKQQREYFEELLKREQSTKQFRHDLISDLLQIQSFCNKKKYDLIEKYVQEMLKDLNVINKNKYDVGNEIINTLLTNYFIPLKDTKIEVKGLVDNDLNVSRRDLCVIVSNLITNAVEAAENNPKALKRIVFKVNQGKQFLYIQVKNTVAHETFFVKNNLPITSKDDKQVHGFGIKNVIAVAKKYNGTYQYKIENDYYIAEVYLKIDRLPGFKTDHRNSVANLK